MLSIHRCLFVTLLASSSIALESQARPVVCTTMIEAPTTSLTGAELVEVTRCGPVERTDAMVERRFNTWTAPYARGIEVGTQITDLLGISLGGAEGNRVMGFGFRDQTIAWDGAAIQNTAEALIEEQSQPTPWRTVDISSGFDSSLAGGALAVEEVIVERPAELGDSFGTPVRGLW